MSEPRLASRSFGEPYRCAQPWPWGCHVQCGDKGVVFKRGTINRIATDPAGVAVEAAAISAGVVGPDAGYTTAFFEAFPNEPRAKTFLRGEGATVEDAEARAWEKFERYRACPGHEFERRHYTNGGGICRHCGMFGSRVFEPIDAEPAS